MQPSQQTLPVSSGGIAPRVLPLPAGERVGVRGGETMRGNVKAARHLRRDQTDAERVIWFRLRDRRLNGWKFRRQVPVDRFIVDFICADAKLIVELDGGQHRPEVDASRTQALEAFGYLVIRFWNNEVLSNTDGVVEDILSVLNNEGSEPPHPLPLPSGERERPA